MNREFVADKIKKGMEFAKNNGTKSGKSIGRPAVKLPEKFKECYNKVLNRELTRDKASQILGVSRMTFFRYIKQYEETQR
jgi:DNA invertase Pin-like site-specific DNA recombinase